MADEVLTTDEVERLRKSLVSLLGRLEAGELAKTARAVAGRAQPQLQQEPIIICVSGCG
jgi:hypothetical protein